MPSSIKDRITNDLNQAKETGQLRAERVREIVRSAVSQVVSELKQGSTDIGSIVKDAISGSIAGLRDRGSEAKEEITASIEGAIEGVNTARQESISKAQAEIKELLAKLDVQEDELQQQVETSLTEVEAAGKDAPPDVKASIESAIHNLKETEEVTLLKRRYAQLQAQLAILRANLAARYPGRYQEVEGYIDEAKNWYSQTRTKSETEGVTPADQKREQLEEKFGEAGTAAAKGERQLRRILSNLLHAAAETLREKDPGSKTGTDTNSSRPENITIK